MIGVHLLWPPGHTDANTVFTDAQSLADIGIEMIIDTMADGDPDIEAVANELFLHASSDSTVIRWRQEVLIDALAHPQLIRDLDSIARHSAVLERRSSYATRQQAPFSQLLRSRELLSLLIGDLEALAKRVREPDNDVSSRGLKLLIATISDNFDDEYLQSLQTELQLLRFENGMVTRATLGAGNLTSDELIVESPFQGRGWRDRLHLVLGEDNRIEIAPRDQAGGETLRELRNLALSQIGTIVAHGLGTVIGFFVTLHHELAWLVGAINLRSQFEELDLPTCMPELAVDGWHLGFRSLCEPTLGLRTRTRPTTNDLELDDSSPIVISGANSGGKTTWLQSVALGILMMQTGLFVAAEEFKAAIRTNLRTFFPDDEDHELQHGRLDDELIRLAATIAELHEGGLVLLNEPLTSTNEIEASEIATAVFRNLDKRGVTVIVVTHYPTLARELASSGLSLRPETVSDGVRTYRIQPSPAPKNSSALDIYRRLGGW
jgi:hypothetical protein